MIDIKKVFSHNKPDFRKRGSMTIKQRHNIYKKALGLLLKAEEEFYLCWIIDFVEKGGKHDNPIICWKVRAMFYEFNLFEPDEYACNVWWPLKDKESRITCLLFCIEMTK